MFETFEKRITQDMSKSEIDKVLHSEKTEYNEVLKELSERVKDGESIDEVIGSIKEEISSSLFLETVKEDLRDCTISFVESEYIRKLDLLSFKDCIQYALDNLLVSKEKDEEVVKYLQIDKTQFGYLVKFMNTANDLIVIKRFTKNNYYAIMFDLFRLEESKTEYIWELFEEKKKSLVTAALLNAITSIRRVNNNIEFLYELLSNLGDE